MYEKEIKTTCQYAQALKTVTSKNREPQIGNKAAILTDKDLLAKSLINNNRHIQINNTGDLLNDIHSLLQDGQLW